jgi:phosphatidylserine/phosphatidylglycerophosphate/cardiolipin synthase-like enzyme
MIIDDAKLIMGSANLNDRSMLGYRDSELAILVDGPFNLQINCSNSQKPSFKVNESVYRYRMKIFKEHFGLEEEDLKAPQSPVFWKQALNTASFNTAFYEKVFNAFPTNRYPTWKDFLESTKKPENEFNAKLFAKYNKMIKGHVVLYPFDFLKQEGLKKAARNTALLVVPVRALF